MPKAVNSILMVCAGVMPSVQSQDQFLAPTNTSVVTNTDVRRLQSEGELLAVLRPRVWATAIENQESREFIERLLPGLGPLTDAFTADQLTDLARHPHLLDLGVSEEYFYLDASEEDGDGTERRLFNPDKEFCPVINRIHKNKAHKAFFDWAENWGWALCTYWSGNELSYMGCYSKLPQRVQDETNQKFLRFMKNNPNVCSFGGLRRLNGEVQAQKLQESMDALELIDLETALWADPPYSANQLLEFGFHGFDCQAIAAKVSFQDLPTIHQIHFGNDEQTDYQCEGRRLQIESREDQMKSGEDPTLQEMRDMFSYVVRHNPGFVDSWLDFDNNANRRLDSAYGHPSSRPFPPETMDILGQEWMVDTFSHAQLSDWRMV